MLVGADVVGARVQLDLSGAVAEIDERGLPLPTTGDDPTGDAVALARLLAVPEGLVGLADVGDRRPPLELMRERLDGRSRAGARAVPAARRAAWTRSWGRRLGARSYERERTDWLRVPRGPRQPRGT